MIELANRIFIHKPSDQSKSLMSLRTHYLKNSECES
jgi:hypothetical protein